LDITLILNFSGVQTYMIKIKLPKKLKQDFETEDGVERN